MIAIVVVPFLLFGDMHDRLVRATMSSSDSPTLAAAAGFFLLAADIVLPVPSTIVISVLGALLGILIATSVSVAGLTLGCLVGYWLGRRLGHDFAERAIGTEDFGFLSDRLDRYGVLVLAICRPVPVLAEASVIAAGVAGLSAGRVLLITTLANLGFASVYAALGASADNSSGFLSAAAASIAVPLVAMRVAKMWKSRTLSP
jgi:uncharacterized membrane protein YdjX (TVP38/TMEM64 family)